MACDQQLRLFISAVNPDPPSFSLLDPDQKRKILRKETEKFNETVKNCNFIKFKTNLIKKRSRNLHIGTDY